MTKAGSTTSTSFSPLAAANREELVALIMEIMARNTVSFEAHVYNDFTIPVLRSITEALQAAEAKDEAKYEISLIREITAPGRELYTLIALKVKDFFTKEDEIHRLVYGDPDRKIEAHRVNRDIGDIFQKAHLDGARSYMQPSPDYDVERHAGILKAQNIADNIRLEQTFRFKVDYYRELEKIREHMDIIEPALSPVIRAAHIIYGKSTTLPDGSGLRRLLDAEAVIAIAKYCGDSEHREELLLALLSEHGHFAIDMLNELGEDSSLALAKGIL